MLHEVKFSTRLVSVLITSEVPAHKQQLVRKVREGMQAGMRPVLRYVNQVQMRQHIPGLISYFVVRHKIQVIIANFLILTANIVN